MTTGRKSRPSAPDIPGLTGQRRHDWTKRKFLHPRRELSDRPAQRGNRLVWSTTELQVAARMAALVDREFPAAVAHHLARRHPDLADHILATLADAPRRAGS